MSDLNYKIPLNIKFNSDSVLYDSIGYNNVGSDIYSSEIDPNYISIFQESKYIYFLKNSSNGYYIKYDTVSEQPVSAYALSGKTAECYSLLTYRDQVYGFNGWNAKYFYNNTALYIKDNNKLVQESFDRKLLVTHLSSTSEIRDIFVDEDYNFYVIHNKSKISKFTKEKKLIYSKNITPDSDTVFASMGILPNFQLEILKFDFVREYTSSGLKKYPIFLGSGVDNQLFLAKFDETIQEVTTAAYIGMSAKYIPYGQSDRINYNLTNYEYLKNRYTNDNELTFKVVLQNVFNNRELIDIEISVPTEKFTSESHHFAYKLDGIDGTVSLLCDGKLISAVEIPKGQYIFQDIFSESMTVGNTYFHNKQNLSQYLQQPLHYHVDNVSMKQFKIYNRILTDTECNYHVYNNIKMDDLVVSLPCGQRSEVESIERQFKMDVSGSKSNNINVIIKNSQITNSILQNQVKTIISDKVRDVLPATININNIEFR